MADPRHALARDCSIPSAEPSIPELLRRKRAARAPGEDSRGRSRIEIVARQWTNGDLWIREGSVRAGNSMRETSPMCCRAV